MRRLILSALLVLVVILPAAILAETVHLKDGRRFSGSVTEKGNVIDLDTGYGVLHINRADILRIEGKTSVAPKPPKKKTAKPKTPVTHPETAEEIRKALLESITSTELSDHVEYLASKELEGRMTGSIGMNLARDYLIAEFESYGLKPGGDTETYAQKFDTDVGDSWNVIGYIEGSDPKLKSEVVVVGGHYDHVGRGRGGKGQIHPGADDNASGTAGVLEIAEAFTEKGIKPKRTVVFICFGAEEIGLVGSRYYCEHPLFPLKNTIAMLNMDMIARNELEKLYVFGLANSKQLQKIVEEANSGELTVTSSQMTPNSDHYSFYAKGVPAIFFNSGMHKDLHKPTDTHDKCDFKKAEKIAELVALSTIGVIEYEGKIEMEKGRERNPWGRRRRGPRLGITPSPAEFTKEDRQKYGLGENDAGIGLQRIHPGTIAEKGGLKKDDIIIELGGERIPFDDMWQWLRKVLTKAQEKKTLTYTVIRDGKKVTGTLAFQDK